MLKKSTTSPIIPQVLILAAIVGCGSDSKSPEESSSSLTCIEQRNELEQSIQKDLESNSTTTDFTLLVESGSGRQFQFSRGSSTPQTSYRSASTSKLVTSAVILSLVDSGELSLQDRPQDYIDNWPEVGNLSNITLGQLLSFTSGLNEDSFCLNLAGADFSACIDSILTLNLESESIAGEAFDYGSAHMQVAGQMAILASGLQTWQQVFEQFKNKNDLFLNGVYDLPSLENPRLAGGMHWTASDYLSFLYALYHRQILTQALFSELTQDQVVDTTILYSPALDGLNEDWHYGLGAWIECHSTTYNCEQVTRVSSPGAYGAYPFMDFSNNYFGILAREGSLGTFTEGYQVFTSVSQELEQWAGKECL